MAKKIDWRDALAKVIRLRKGGLVDDEVLEALRITLDPPSSAVAASPELVHNVRSHISEVGFSLRNRRKDQVATRRRVVELQLSATKL